MDVESLSPEDALVAVMIAVAAADERMTDSELAWITATVAQLPVFRAFDPERIRPVSTQVAAFLGEEDGLDQLIDTVRVALPAHLHETAYALACDVAAADGRVSEIETRLLEMLRDDLGLENLAAAGIERGARARHQRLEPRTAN
ncbi:MAG: tellurite resistance TerB family protein [Paracoccaceae bacterium]